jgi:hypothetical protein
VKYLEEFVPLKRKHQFLENLTVIESREQTCSSPAKLDV